MGIHDPAESPTISYDFSGVLKQDMSIPINFPSHLSGLPFQQIVNNNDQNQASALFMFLYGDSTCVDSNSVPSFSQQPMISNSEMIRPPVKKKRSQVRNACVNCQKSNKKCEEVRPCSRCIKNHLVDSCTNSKRKKRQKGIKRGPYKRRKQANSESNSHVLPMDTMIPLLETPVTTDVDTSFTDFTNQPLDFDLLPRFFMQSLSVPALDDMPPYPVLSFEDGHASLDATVDSTTQCPIKNQDNPFKMVSNLLDDTLVKNFANHALDNRLESSCRPLSLNHETDLGTLASLCAAVLGED